MVDPAAEFHTHGTKLPRRQREQPLPLGAGSADRQQRLRTRHGDFALTGRHADHGAPPQQIGKTRINPRFAGAIGEAGADRAATVHLGVVIVDVACGKPNTFDRAARPPLTGGLVAVALQVDADRPLVAALGGDAVVALGSTHGRADKAGIAEPRRTNGALIGIAVRAGHPTAQGRVTDDHPTRHPNIPGALAAQLEAIGESRLAPLHAHATQGPATRGVEVTHPLPADAIQRFAGDAPRHHVHRSADGRTAVQHRRRSTQHLDLLSENAAGGNGMVRAKRGHVLGVHAAIEHLDPAGIQTADHRTTGARPESRRLHPRHSGERIAKTRTAYGIQALSRQNRDRPKTLTGRFSAGRRSGDVDWLGLQGGVERKCRSWQGGKKARQNSFFHGSCSSRRVRLLNRPLAARRTA